jgi:hypothetical protein
MGEQLATHPTISGLEFLTESSFIPNVAVCHACRLALLYKLSHVMHRTDRGPIRYETRRARLAESDHFCQPRRRLKRGTLTSRVVPPCVPATVNEAVALGSPRKTHMRGM